MTTNTPAGIAALDTMQTRLGTLNFFDGFPDKVTVEKVYDNLDFQRAVQAYLLALAPVNMAGLREGLSIRMSNLSPRSRRMSWLCLRCTCAQRGGRR